MPVVTDITALSTTASSNYPAGTENANTVDDYIRQQSAFIAQLRDRAISVKDYGATGDGVTDDTTAIHAAYAAAVANDRALYIPTGDYLVSGLTFDGAINVVGESELTRFLASANSIDIVTVTGGDKTPGKAYIPTIGNFVVWANGKTGCVGVRSYNANGCNYESISIDDCDQGFRAQGDQYCSYTNVRARNCTIGIRLVDDTAGGLGGGNNNVFINCSANVCDIGFMFGRSSAPYPLHTVSVINAVALGSSFSSYVVFSYEGLTFTNCSPESTVTGTIPTAYDGETVTPGLGYFNEALVTLRDTLVATSDEAFTLASNSAVTFDGYSGATCSIVTDSTSVANLVSATRVGNNTQITANQIQSLIAESNRTTSFIFPHEVQYCANLENHTLDPITLVANAVINASITSAIDWHSALGVCGSMVINDGSSVKGISTYFDGTAFGANSTFLIGVSVVSDTNCSLRINYAGQVSATFSLTADIPVRLYVVGGGSASGTMDGVSIDIMDTSGAKVYIGKLQANVSSDTNHIGLFSKIMRNHLYNSKRAWGDVGVHTAAPSNGTFAVGDVVYSRTPASSGYIGWVCTVAGSPGTWKGFGAIA